MIHIQCCRADISALKWAIVWQIRVRVKPHTIPINKYRFGECRIKNLNIFVVCWWWEGENLLESVKNEGNPIFSYLVNELSQSEQA